MSTVSESIPTPDQVQAGDTQAGVYDPNDPEGPPPERRFLIGASIFIGYFVVVLLVAKFAPGTAGSIGRGMLRESLSAQTAAVAIAIIGLNVHFGYTGLLNMGQSGFMMLGAYGFAISIWKGLPMPVGILLGFLAAFVFALILGVPTLKLRGDYLAIVTISAAEILRYVGRLAQARGLHRRRPGHPGLAVPRARSPTCRSSATAPSTRAAGCQSSRPPASTAGGSGSSPGCSSRSARTSSSCSPAARGAVCCAASARTRTPSAAWARTSSPSRCRP